MGLYMYNGKLLVRGNALAGSAACCCGTPPPPCPPCLGCEWPELQRVGYPAEWTLCFGDEPQAVQKYYSQDSSINGLPTTQWLPQFDTAQGGNWPLVGCKWTFVIDYEQANGCCDILPQCGDTQLLTRWRWRIRMLLVTACPEDGEPTVEDVTDQYVDVANSVLEGEYDPSDYPSSLGPECNCLSPPLYAPYVGFLPDPESWVTCNPFP